LGQGDHDPPLFVKLRYFSVVIRIERCHCGRTVVFQGGYPGKVLAVMEIAANQREDPTGQHQHKATDDEREELQGPAVFGYGRIFLQFSNPFSKGYSDRNDDGIMI